MSRRLLKRQIPFASIANVKLSIMSEDDIKNMSAVDVKENSNPVEPTPFSSEDTSLGARPNYKCTYCGNEYPVCPGHHGKTTIKYPVILPIARTIVIHYAKVICLKCGTFMLGDKRLVGRIVDGGHIVVYDIKFLGCVVSGCPSIVTVSSDTRLKDFNNSWFHNILEFSTPLLE